MTISSISFTSLNNSNSKVPFLKSEIRNIKPDDSALHTNELKQKSKSENIDLIKGIVVGAMTVATCIVMSTKMKANKLMFKIHPSKPNLPRGAVANVNAPKLVKGKAVTATGEPYSGVVLKKIKSGRQVQLSYENGFLRESVLRSEKGIPLKKKEYLYDGHGKLFSVEHKIYTPAKDGINPEWEQTNVSLHGEGKKFAEKAAEFLSKILCK